MRLFVGLVPSIEGLMRMEASYPLALPAGSRRVPSANLHLTLAFVANYPETQLEDLKQTLHQEAFQGVKAFYLEPQRLYWHGSTLWLEFREEARLSALAEKLHHLLGVPFRKPFRPHVTLARRRRMFQLPLVDYPLRLGPEPLLFAEAYLFQSHLSRTGVTYERLARYPLSIKTNPPL